MSLTFDVYGTAALFDRVGRAMFALGDGTVRFEDGGQGGREWKRRGEGSPRLVSPGSVEAAHLTPGLRGVAA